MVSLTLQIYNTLHEFSKNLFEIFLKKLFRFQKIKFKHILIFFDFFIWQFKKTSYLCIAIEKSMRAFSSAGSEHLPYKQRVGGSNPSTPTETKIDWK